MDSLDGRTTGLFRVTTVSAEYLIDLDGMRLGRMPSEPDEAIRTMREDNNSVVLLKLIRCRPGLPMVIDIDLHAPGVVFTRRTSTEVIRIEPLQPLPSPE